MNSMTLSLKSIVESRAEIGSQLIAPGDAVLIIRKQPRWLLLKCPCGCNDDVPVNLDHRAGQAWRMYRGRNKKLTLFPSVWRDTGCLSHFIIRNSQILLFGHGENYVFQKSTHLDIYPLVTRVLDTWPHDRWVQYVDVADQLGEIPWDVLDACKHLVKTGDLLRGRGKLHLHFRRR